MLEVVVMYVYCLMCVAGDVNGVECYFDVQHGLPVFALLISINALIFL